MAYPFSFSRLVIRIVRGFRSSAIFPLVGLSQDRQLNIRTNSTGNSKSFSINKSAYYRLASDQFADLTPGSEDLHLKGTADAIDQGDDLSGNFSTDFEGQRRPNGIQWDIGADERAANGVCPTDNAPWYDTDWQYRKAIALNSTLVVGTLTDFPVLVVKVSSVAR